MRFIPKRISCDLYRLFLRVCPFPEVITKENPEIILPGINDSCDVYRFILDPVKRNMLSADKETEVRRVAGQCLNRRASFRKAGKCAELFCDRLNGLFRSSRVFQFFGDILLYLRQILGSFRRKEDLIHPQSPTGPPLLPS